jgi:transcriptional antiterminator NusG
MIYVLHVTTGKELAVSGELKKIYCRALVPREICTERKNGKIEKKERVLFPGYVFIDTILNLQAYYKIKAITNVIKFLGEGTPAELPAAEEKYIEWLNGENKPLEVSQIDKDGNILSGPLKGYEALILSIDKRQRRAKVSIMINGEQQTVSLSTECIDFNGD